MPFALDNFLFRQAIRLRREDWKDPQLLGDELYTILSSIQVADLAPVETDENGNPIDYGDVNPLPGLPTDLPDFVGNPEDPQRPEPPSTDIDPDTDDTGAPPGGGGDGDSTKTQKFWIRAIHPGKLTSDSDGSSFSCDLYYNGLGQQPRAITATITDPTLASDVESGTWVDVYMIVQYEGTSQVVDGQRIPTEYKVLSLEYLFNAPGSAQGGRWGVVTTTVTSGSASTPGEGKVMLKKKTEAGAWVDDVPSDVYSTVSGTVKADKVVQLKRISGDLFVDVEDCGSEDTPDSGPG